VLDEEEIARLELVLKRRVLDETFTNLGKPYPLTRMMVQVRPLGPPGASP
jgi:hypothetical protein